MIFFHSDNCNPWNDSKSSHLTLIQKDTISASRLRFKFQTPNWHTISWPQSTHPSIYKPIIFVFDPHPIFPSYHHHIITSQPLDAVESDTHRLHAKPHGPVPRVRLAVFCLQLFIHLWGVNTSGWELAPDLQRFDVQPGFHIESKNANKISKIYIMIAMIVGICTYGSLNQTDFGW